MLLLHSPRKASTAHTLASLMVASCSKGYPWRTQPNKKLEMQSISFIRARQCLWQVPVKVPMSLHKVRQAMLPPYTVYDHDGHAAIASDRISPVFLCRHLTRAKRQFLNLQSLHKKPNAYRIHIDWRSCQHWVATRKFGTSIPSPLP